MQAYCRQKSFCFISKKTIPTSKNSFPSFFLTKPTKWKNESEVLMIWPDFPYWIFVFGHQPRTIYCITAFAVTLTRRDVSEGALLLSFQKTSSETAVCCTFLLHKRLWFHIWEGRGGLIPSSILLRKRNKERRASPTLLSPKNLLSLFDIFGVARICLERRRGDEMLG